MSVNEISDRRVYMRLISSEDLYKRLTELKERYKNSDDIVDRAIVIGLDRAITEVVLSQTQAYKK